MSAINLLISFFFSLFSALHLTSLYNSISSTTRKTYSAATCPSSPSLWIIRNSRKLLRQFISTTILFWTGGTRALRYRWKVICVSRFLGMISAFPPFATLLLTLFSFRLFFISFPIFFIFFPTFLFSFHFFIAMCPLLIFFGLRIFRKVSQLFFDLYNVRNHHFLKEIFSQRRHLENTC